MNNIVNKTLEFAITSDTPCLLVGEAGVGKNYIINKLAEKYNARVTRVSLTGDVEAEELIGKIGLLNGNTVWVDGVVTNAIRRGDWLVLDEVNAAPASVLFALHSLLDDDRALTLNNHPNKEVVKKHKDTRIFATANPVSYSGTKIPNFAFLSRFVLSIEINRPTEKQAVEIIKSHNVSEGFADFAAKLYERLGKEELDIPFTLREAIVFGSLVEEGFNPKEAMLAVYSGKNAIVEGESLDAMSSIIEEVLQETNIV